MQPRINHLYTILLDVIWLKILHLPIVLSIYLRKEQQLSFILVHAVLILQTNLKKRNFSNSAKFHPHTPSGISKPPRPPLLIIHIHEGAFAPPT